MHTADAGDGAVADASSGDEQHFQQGEQPAVLGTGQEQEGGNDDGEAIHQQAAQYTGKADGSDGDLDSCKIEDAASPSTNQPPIADEADAENGQTSASVDGVPQQDTDDDNAQPSLAVAPDQDNDSKVQSEAVDGHADHSVPEEHQQQEHFDQQLPPQTHDGDTTSSVDESKENSHVTDAHLNGDAESIMAVTSSTADAPSATTFDFLPFFPNGTSDMTRLAEAWQQNQHQIDAEASAGQGVDDHKQETQGDGSVMMDHSRHTSGDDQAQQQQQFHLANLEPNGKPHEVGADTGDAGLLLGMAAENSDHGTAAQQHAPHQQLQHALAQHAALAQVSAPSPAHAYTQQAPMGGYSTPGSSNGAAQAAVAAQDARSTEAIVAALTAHQNQQDPATWNNISSALANYAGQFNNPQYRNDIAGFNQQPQQPQHQQQGHHALPPHPARPPPASTSPNTVGGHTHRPGSGHAFCTGAVVEGTDFRRFIFPLAPEVSSGRKKHVKSAQEMADTFPLATSACDRCHNYENPLPCFHKEGSKCVYCKFLSKPCSLQPGGTNNKERRADGTSIANSSGSFKKKRKGNNDEVYPQSDASTSTATGLPALNGGHQQYAPTHLAPHGFPYSHPTSGTATPNGDISHAHQLHQLPNVSVAAQEHQNQLQEQLQAQARAQAQAAHAIQQAADAHHQQQQQQQAVVAALQSQPPSQAHSHASTPQPQIQPQNL